MSRIYSHSSKAAVSINKTTFCTVTISNYNTVWTYTNVPGKPLSPGPICTPLASSHKVTQWADTCTRLTAGKQRQGRKEVVALKDKKDRNTDYGSTVRIALNQRLEEGARWQRRRRHWLRESNWAFQDRTCPAHQAVGQPLPRPGFHAWAHTDAPYPEHTESPASLPPTSAPLISIVAAHS